MDSENAAKPNKYKHVPFYFTRRRKQKAKEKELQDNLDSFVQPSHSQADGDKKKKKKSKSDKKLKKKDKHSQSDLVDNHKDAGIVDDRPRKMHPIFGGDDEDYTITDMAKNRRKKIKHKTEQEVAEQDASLDLVVTPLAKGKRSKKPDSFLHEDADSQSERAADQSTVTFHNTKNYSKYLRARTDREDPEFLKYSAGAGSVKGLHYRKFVALELLSEHSFTLAFHKFYSQEVKNLIKSIYNTRFDPDLRVWVINMVSYPQVMTELRKICSANQIHIEDIPTFVMHLMKTQVPYSLSPNSLDGTHRARFDYKNDKTTGLDLEEFVPVYIYRSLYPFQKENIRKAIKMHGRILINDDFGCGKSLQALTVALAYKTEWPLLVVCQQVSKFGWRHEILKWMPGIDFSKIQVLKNDHDKIREGVMIVVASYEQASRQSQQILAQGFKVAIVDEVQVFKDKLFFDGGGKRVVHLVAEMKRCVLLTGYKLLKKPRHLYYLMRMIRPDLMPGFIEFGYRYCDPRQAPSGIDFDHASNLAELKSILRKRIQVRNRRGVVFDELSSFSKRKLEVQVDLQLVVKIQTLIRNYLLPWEQQNSTQSFFEEMFSNQYGPHQDQAPLQNPMDESKPSF